MNITMKQFFEMVTKTIAEPNTTITDSYPAILARSLAQFSEELEALPND